MKFKKNLLDHGFLSLEIYNNSKTNHDNLIIFKYVGELSVKIDEDIYNFQNKYSSIGEVELFIPANKQVTINYIYRYSAPIGNHPGAPMQHCKF